MPSLALSDLIGAPVIDNTGASAGKVREVTLVPQENSSQIAGFVVKTRHGDRLLPTEVAQPDQWRPADCYPRVGVEPVRRR